MSSSFCQLQFSQDPTRLTLPSSPAALLSAGPGASAIVNFFASASGQFDVNVVPGTSPNYNDNFGSWWGVLAQRYGGFDALTFPGSLWEAMMDVVSGTPSPGFSGSTLGTFFRIDSDVSWSWSRNTGLHGAGTNTFTVRVSFRRFGTTSTLGSCDFPLSIQSA